MLNNFKKVKDVGDFFFNHLINEDHDNYNHNNNDLKKYSNINNFLYNNNDNINNNDIKKMINKKNDEVVNEDNKNEIKDKNDLIINEKTDNVFANEDHFAKKEEINEKEMLRLSNELSKCFNESQKKMRNIDINNDTDGNSK